MEIRYNGQWGTVCDDNWDMNDAAVVCRQSQCGSVISAPLSASFGPGSESIWLMMFNVQEVKQSSHNVHTED